MKNEYAAKRSLVINPLLIVCFLLMLSAQISGQVAISPKPAWVKTINPENQEIIEETGGYQLHLLDDQVHIPGQAWFVHRTYRLLTSSGVQSMSTITASYDPSYQELNFHKLTITRDGQTINKLGAGNIETYQRETSMERHILMLVISSLTAFAEYLSYDQLSEYLVFDSSRAEMGKYAGRAFLGLVIWVPYFAISKRVKSTFTRRYKKEKLPEENRQVFAAVKTV
jgi:hypothetical protein